MKNILIISASPINKASGRISLELLELLSKNENFNVRLLVKYTKIPNRNIISFYSKTQFFFERLVRFVLKYIFNSNNNYYFENNNSLWFNKSHKIINKVAIIPDITIALFMTSFISFKDLYYIQLKTNSLIFIYMMDMAPLTGGCHYAWDCRAYETKCGKCPALNSNNENDLSRKYWEFKKKYISKTNITVISASFWQHNQLLKTSLYSQKDKIKIFSPTNESFFNYGDKFLARDFLKLPINKKIILFGSVSVSERRKGFNELINTLIILKNLNISNNIHLAIAGNVDKYVISKFPFDFTILGFLTYAELVKAYQAADIFLNTSIEDSGPTMINQALMCGTPIAAFEMGVAPDLVINGKTGIIANLYNCKDLAIGINKILDLDDCDYNSYRKNCRELALKTCSYNVVYKEFIKLIN
jgi:glycosyltransferase involved in cell wall biosynthesis